MNTYAERARLQRIKDLKQRLEEAKLELEIAQRQGQYERASQLRFATIPELQRQLPAETERAQGESEAQGPLPMLHDRVTSDDIARVVAKATGIPVQNLLKGERDKLVHVRSDFLYPITAFGQWLIGIFWRVDGGDAPPACCGARPRRRCCQRCCENLACGTASTQPACGILPVPWTNWRRQGASVM